jgi:hypothetical protein
MGIFSRKGKDGGIDGAGTVSEPQGDGPVTLADRTAPGGEGSPDTNQGKTEPMSATPDHPEPMAAPSLEDMSAGAAAAQLPSHPAAADHAPPGSYGGGDAGDQPMGLGGPGVVPSDDRPTVDTETSTGRAHGPTGPVQRTSGEAHRAGGLNGVAPAGESIETDVEGGATRMGAAPPDAVPGLSSGHGETGLSPAPGPGDAPALGTSETQPKVEGIRLPEAEGPQ